MRERTEAGRVTIHSSAAATAGRDGLGQCIQRFKHKPRAVRFMRGKPFAVIAESIFL